MKFQILQNRLYMYQIFSPHKFLCIYIGSYLCYINNDLFTKKQTNHSSTFASAGRDLKNVFASFRFDFPTILKMFNASLP